MTLGARQFGTFWLISAIFLAGCGATGADSQGSTSGTGGSLTGTGSTSGVTGGALNGTGGAPRDTGGSGGTPSTGGVAGAASAPSTGGVAGAASTPHLGGPTTPVRGGDEVPAALSQALTAAAEQTGASLRASHPVELASSLGYDASKAAGLSLIQASPLALSTAQLAKLSENGLVIAKERTFPSFIYGYKSIYAADLPVYVSADSILYAVHHSFDKVLEMVEEGYLVSELDQLLDDVRTNLTSSSIDEATQRDVDLYVAVAKSLLNDRLEPPVAGADVQTVSSLVAKAQAGTGHELTTLFGAERDEDFSQFKPRGHYTHSPALTQFFRAMMWLGRVDLRVVETLSDGSQVFRRPQFDAAVALYEALGASGREHWAHVDELVGWFVGERDSASISDMTEMLTKIDAATFADAKAVSDQKIIDVIAAGWGAQRIASRIIIKNAVDQEPLPLDRSFALFGQRYTVDSHVFVNTTYDRVAGRMMPNPLDVAFAALGNDSALSLLGAELDDSSYVGGLGKTRVLVDAHEAPYWEGSLYTQWLGALRALSPKAGDTETLPSVALMPAFRERILNTQLASWAELRRDTILYAKQSYTTGATCEFPDAYVDPYPEFYAQLGRLAEHLRQIGERFPAALAEQKKTIDDWAANFSTVSGNLELMAKNQRSGAAHSAELMAFINEAVNYEEGFSCTLDRPISSVSGWYSRLFYAPTEAVKFDPTIADVHTQPTDAAGNDVGRVLHVGTGYARAMVVTVNTCSGPRAYAGLASSYSEKITENWQRLNDQEWSTMIQGGQFVDVPWMSRVLSQ